MSKKYFGLPERKLLAIVRLAAAGLGIAVLLAIDPSAALLACLVAVYGEALIETVET